MFIGRLEITIFLLTFKRGLRLLLTRRNNYSAHLNRERKFFHSKDHLAYRLQKKKKKEEEKIGSENAKDAETEAREALKAFDNDDVRKMDSMQDSMRK